MTRNFSGQTKVEAVRQRSRIPKKGRRWAKKGTKKKKW